MSQNFDPNLKNNRRIDESRLSEVYDLVNISIGDCTKVYQLQLIKELQNQQFTSQEAYDNSLHIQLFESILKAGLDGESQTILLIESSDGSSIYFLDDNKKIIASILTGAPAMLVLRQVLQHHSWEMDDDGNSSVPIFYFKFSEELKGAVSISPSTIYEDGTVATTISILRPPSIYYISHEIIED
jgi:hypothetical protein